MDTAKIFVQVSPDHEHFRSVACIKEFESPLIYLAESDRILNHFARATQSVSARLKIVQVDGEVMFSEPLQVDSYAKHGEVHLH